MSATTCPHCGANLSLDDMTRPNCPYCRTVLPHHARAAEHAALVNRVLAQQIGAQYPGAPPPQIGYGYGAPLQGMQPFQQHQMNRAMQRAGWITAVAVLVPVVLVLVAVGVGFAVFLIR